MAPLTQKNTTLIVNTATSLHLASSGQPRVIEHHRAASKTIYKIPSATSIRAAVADTPRFGQYKHSRDLPA